MAEPSIGVVAIGRNEGERLRRCLQSLLPGAVTVVYVDSGSEDGSPEVARQLGADVVALDMRRPFTAARARNEGFERLLQRAPDVEWVQFVDGDCEVVQGWLPVAVEFLQRHPAYAVVCGRRRERYPERSVYNRLCDEEWNTPVGDARSCGGDALFRVSAFQAVGGYRNGLIAGEEPELCVRLRQQGWKVHRLDHDMTLHDAAMTRLGQWWKRSVRAGHAFAEGAWLHGGPPERHWVRETLRALLWGLAVPVGVALLALLLGAGWLGLLAVYPLQWLRFWKRSGDPAQAGFLVLGKFAEAAGVIKFHTGRLMGRGGRIIEYK